MVKTIFRADDGNEFDSMAKAHQHEAFLQNQTAFKEAVYRLARDDGDTNTDMAVEFVMRNAVELLAVLQTYSMKTEDDDEDEDEPFTRPKGRR